MDIGEVDWKRLAAALDWYEAAGFRKVSLPWHARQDVIDVTCPSPDRCYRLQGVGTLVGSAEQSFMQAQFDGLLSKGRWVSLTPCFRHEPVFDVLHHPYFMKVELYSNEGGHDGLDVELAGIARRFMETQGAHGIETVRTDVGYDLEIGGIEVGSYSTREHAGHVWTCGTGLAEPRFSQALAAAGKP